MRSLFLCSAALIAGASTPAVAANLAQAGANAACGLGASASGPLYASATDTTAPVSEDNPCDPHGASTVDSWANGKAGVLGSHTLGYGLYGIDGGWSHSLTSDLRFLSSGSGPTTVTFHVTGSTTATPDMEFTDISADEYLSLALTGDLGAFSSGLLHVGTDGTLSQDFSFTFSGPAANVHVIFAGFGQFSAEIGGTADTNGLLSISTSSGSFRASGNYFGAVPEPASWAMMAGGFGLIGGAARSRRRVAARFA